MTKIDKIIQLIRSSLNEEPTMSVGTRGFSNASSPSGPVAGYDKPLDFRTRLGRRVKLQPIAKKEAKNVRQQR